MIKKITAALLAFAMLFGFILPVTDVQAAEAAKISITQTIPEAVDTADKIAAKAVEDKINAIGKVEDTRECYSKIEAARKAYNALTVDQKALLPNAEKQISDARVEWYQLHEAKQAELAKVRPLIQRIIDLEEITLEDKVAIESIRVDYNALKPFAQEYFQNYYGHNYLTDLEAAEAKLAVLEKAEVDQTAADAVIAKIAAIGDVTYTSECKARIDAAQKAYNALTADQKKLVTNLNVWEQANVKYHELESAHQEELSKVMPLIQRVIDLGDITLEDKAAVESIRADYNALKPFAQDYFKNYSEHNYLTDLEAAEAKLAVLEADKAAAKAVEDKITAIGEVTYSPECKNKIAVAESAYNELTADQKELVSNKAILDAAKASYAKLQSEQSKPGVNTKPEAGKPEVTIPDTIPSDKKTTVEAAAKGTTVDTNSAAEQLNAAAKDAVDKITDEEKSNAQQELNKKFFNETAGKDVEICAQTYMEVQPQAYTPSKDENKAVYTVNITPMLRVVATTNTNNIDLSKNAVAIGEAKRVELSQAAVTVTIPIPAGFAVDGEIIYINHKKANGDVYQHQCVVMDGKVSFENTHGFSEFSLKKTSDTVATINDQPYKTLQAAIDAVQDGETIKLVKDCEEQAIVTRDITFKVDASAFVIDTDDFTDEELKALLKELFTVGANTTCEVSKSSSSESKIYIFVIRHTEPPVQADTITIDAAENGTVVADPAKAKEGQTVTLTATPAEGYELAGIVVTDEAGAEVEAVAVDGQPNKVKFTMPKGKVNVKATFKKVEEKPEASFSDVAGNEWFAEAVQYVADKGIMAGYPDGTFGPANTTTRGMIVTMLYNMEEKPAISGDNSFSDVANADWFSNGVWWAEHNGIVKGYEDGTFQPNKEISRQEMAAILYRYAEYKGYDLAADADLGSFTDADQVSAWAKQAMKWANANKIINGMGDGTLAPQGDTTRAQVATLFMNFCENMAK